MWLRYKKIDCPDKTVRFVLRNPNKAFPLYAKDYKSSVDSALKIAEKLKLKLKGEHQIAISGLFAQIDESNKNVQMSIRAVYEDFITNPCQKDKLLTAQINLILERENHLRNLYCGLEYVKQLVTSKSETELIDKAITRLVSENATSNGNDVEKEFKKAWSNIKKWEE
jgi:hypothetical protein